MAEDYPNSQNPPIPEPKPEPEEVLRLKKLAEQKYVAGNLKSALKYVKRANLLNPSLDGVPEMLTALRIIRTAKKTVGLTPVEGAPLSTSISTPAPPDYYKILQVERFAHINTIKKQYKKLALTLHPDKNSFVASEEAFKHVGEAFRILSDKIRRKEYDMKVRIAMQSKAEAEAAAGVGSEIGELETFWTACSTCRLLHKFERKYLGLDLVCPSCKKSFKAVEVDEENEKVDKVEQGERVAARVSERIRARKGWKMSTVGEILKRSIKNRKGSTNRGENEGLRVTGVEKDLVNGSERTGLGSCGGGGVIEGLRSRSRRKEERSVGEKVMARTRAKRLKVVEEGMMTLAEMQMQTLAKNKMSEERMILKGREKGEENKKVKGKEKDMEIVWEKEEEMGEDKGRENEKLQEKEMEKDKERENKKLRDKKDMAMGKVNEREKRPRPVVLRTDSVEIVGRRACKIIRDSQVDKPKKSRRDDLDIVAVEQLDFYDFNADKPERSFKKGQVWATYDSEDGMPRRYALIDEVVSVNPLEVRLSWLQFQSNGDEQLIRWENMGFHISWGRFKVSEKTSVRSLKMFSHIADFERAAREVYWIYPRKGSIWALYNENELNSEGRDLKDKYCYDIVVFLTSYSEIHGMSMAYLEKVGGFKTVFKRREIGAQAIRWLEKDEFRLFSHQIPAKKLSGEEASGLPKDDCWELDPSALPPEPLTIGWGR